ncbi:ATP-binding protein [Algoriphagus sediminis]|uniref:ATP-binding protein n=1 Tax=Algoriphagus sediminis TaxID=3057113 RepID=A0ABT7YA47_9BACT|nr:ATP-binding protein [Algoriphagus sediminis]MDN3203404.1 ATP-binding protein [Algoriphagus sediminis]
MSIDHLLRLTERVEIAVELGESYYREFKSGYQGAPSDKKPRDFKDICYNVAKELVAFANADGGELFIGIEDDNQITGLPHSDEQLNQILQASSNYILKETPLPIKRRNIIEYQGKKVIYFSVDKGSKFIHQTSKGECFKREDKDSIPTSADNIRFVREEASSRQYDREFEDLATVTDLDLSLVSSVAFECTKIKDISPEKFLQYMELAEFDGDRLRLRKAALLLFAKNPNKWHPRSRVRILKVNGLEEKSAPEYNVTEIADVSGNVFQLAADSWEALRPALSETRYSEDGLFKTQVIYPEPACREALINAITHRDYSLEGRGIEIRIFTDRLEVLSPGKLLSKLTIEDLKELKGAHETRNAYVARVLREYGYIRELGEGIRRMFEVMKSNELIEPQIASPNKSFIVTLFYKFIYSKEEKLWLDNFKEFNLSREQKTVIKLGVNDRLVSPKEIFENVGIVDTEKYRQLVESLAELGILKREVTANKAYSLARSNSVSKKSIGIYKICVPDNSSDQSKQEKREKDNSDYAKVFVRGLDWFATESDLEKALSKFGNIAEISIPKNRYTGKSKGFAFVEFDENESVKKALNSDERLEVKGRRIFLQEFKE